MTYKTYEELNQIQQVELDSFPKLRLFDYAKKEALVAIKEKLGVNNFAECLYINSDQVLIAKKEKDRYCEMRNRQYEEKSNFIINNIIHVIRSEMMDYGYIDLKNQKPILDSLKDYVDIECEGFKEAWALAEKYESEPEIYFDSDGLVDRIISADVAIRLGVVKELYEFKKILDSADFSRLTDSFIHSSSTSVRVEMVHHGYIEGLEHDYSDMVQKAIREYYQKQEKQSNLTIKREEKQRQRQKQIMDNGIKDIEI